MQQYFRLKAEHPQALLFFRMGDFYELFFEDAVTAAQVLDITLTSRSKDRHGQPIPMCGVPHHAAMAYITRLVRQGFHVALCEQMEDPRQAQGVVKRDVVRVITPGTQIEAGALESGEDSFIAALAAEGETLGVAYLDATTGRFFVLELKGDARWQRLRDLVGSDRPREILAASDLALPEFLIDLNQPEGGIPLTRLDETQADARRARQVLLDHFGVLSLAAFGCEQLPAATTAGGMALRYVRDTQRRDLTHITDLTTRATDSVLAIDALTRRNLELVENLADGGRRGTLLDILDATRTAMGARLLREYLLHPLMNVESIQDRLDAVEELAFRSIERSQLRERLAAIQDIERLLGRVTLGNATPRDLAALARSITVIPTLGEHLAECLAPLIRLQLKDLDPPLDCAERVIAQLADAPPTTLREPGVIRDGVDAELDELRAICHGGRATIAAIEERERTRTGITSLKVRFNRVFGYFLEVSKSNLALVPADYTRKQTIAGGERFVTPELKEYEEKVLTAEGRILAREAELFEALRAAMAGEARRLQQTSRAVAVLDVMAALAESAASYGYVKPRIALDRHFSFVEGRHPMMERLLKDPFVPNDLAVGEDAPRVLILTGPNMGGKSTFLRQTALMALMAQMGSFVPAHEAKLSIVDRIFTRVGATDHILRGQSTFMVEMQETAHIVRHATDRSLILLDEIGRGTATYDGLSIAWAVAEHFAAQPSGPKTLFATHYHELTDLAGEYPSVGNLHVSAREWKDNVIFLRKIEAGGCDRSFGIQVARLAGLPQGIIARAQEILRNLERSEFDKDGRPRLAHSKDERPSERSRQMQLFSDPGEGVLDELRRVDANHLTPLQALTLLTEIIKKLQ
jgi:DNA mismatch repair protein MutS